MKGAGEFPPNAFVDPRGGNLEHMKELASRMAEIALAHTSSAAARDVVDRVFQRIDQYRSK